MDEELTHTGNEGMQTLKSLHGTRLLDRLSADVLEPLAGVLGWFCF